MLAAEGMKKAEEGPEALDRFFAKNADRFLYGPQTKGGPRELKDWLNKQQRAYSSAQRGAAPAEMQGGAGTARTRRKPGTGAGSAVASTNGDEHEATPVRPDGS